MRRLLGIFQDWVARIPRPPGGAEAADVARRQREMAETLAALQARADLIQRRIEREAGRGAR